MLNRLLIGALLGALSGAACSSAPQQVQSTPPELAEPLQALAPLVGGEWVAEFPGSLTDFQRFEPVLDGHFLRNVHEVRDEDGAVVYAGETFYGWDEPAQILRWWYFNTTGGFVVGTAVAEQEGELVYEGENHAAAAQTARVRGSFLLDEALEGRYTSVTFFLKDGSWQVERQLVYRRR